jgi:hypothetical protein
VQVPAHTPQRVQQLVDQDLMRQCRGLTERAAALSSRRREENHELRRSPIYGILLGIAIVLLVGHHQDRLLRRLCLVEAERGGREAEKLVDARIAELEPWGSRSLCVSLDR